MASEQYEELLKNKKVLLLPDVFPWSGITYDNTYISQGIVNNFSVYAGANIGKASLTFPKKEFGDHIKGLTPIKICIEEPDDIFFRGFVTDEVGSLTESEDSVKASALDYKWYFSKCTRIRGKWFSTIDVIPSPVGSPVAVGSDKLYYEMFKGSLRSDSGNAGYLQTVPCVFNQGGFPDCYTSSHAGNKCIFKFRRIRTTDNIQYIESYNYNAYYWTYSSILSHIAYWWLDPYSGTKSVIKISDDSYTRLSKLSSDDQIPIDLSIEGKNPLEAIDSVVKCIPGKWTWRLYYSGIIVYIDIVNLEYDATEATGRLKKLYIGNYSKTALIGSTADNLANVVDINVNRSYDQSCNYLILKGGKIKWTTTVELLPVWKSYSFQYTERNKSGSVVRDVVDSPFESVEDFETWKKSIAVKDEKETLENVNKNSYMAYRYYCIPKEGALLKACLDNISYKTETYIPDRVKLFYGKVTTKLKEMLINGTNVSEKTFESPTCNPMFSNPVFFSYDQYGKYEVNLDKDGAATKTLNQSKAFTYYESGYSFDSDTGLLIFDTPQNCRFSKKVSSTAEVKSDKKKKAPAIEITDLPSTIMYQDIHVDTTSVPLSRRIFCTLTLVLDYPYIVGDNIWPLKNIEGGNLSRYMDFTNNDLVIHSNAFYPVLASKGIVLDSASTVPSTITMAKANGLHEAVSLTKSSILAEKNLGLIYPCDLVTGYKVCPDDSDKVLYDKLQNIKKTINYYDESINATLASLDLTYDLCDIIIGVEGSTSDDDMTKGYSGMQCYVSELTVALDAGKFAYYSSIVATNNVNFVPSEADKKMQDVIKRPSSLRGRVGTNDFLEVKDAD